MDITATAPGSTKICYITYYIHNVAAWHAANAGQQCNKNLFLRKDHRKNVKNGPVWLLTKATAWHLVCLYHRGMETFQTSTTSQLLCVSFLYFFLWHYQTKRHALPGPGRGQQLLPASLPPWWAEKDEHRERSDRRENDLTTVFSLNWLIFLWDTSEKVEEKQSCGRQTAASVSSLCFSVHQTDVWCSYNFVTSLWYSQTWRADSKHLNTPTFVPSLY